MAAASFAWRLIQDSNCERITNINSNHPVWRRAAVVGGLFQGGLELETSAGSAVGRQAGVCLGRSWWRGGGSNKNWIKGRSGGPG